MNKIVRDEARGQYHKFKVGLNSIELYLYHIFHINRELKR